MCFSSFPLQTPCTLKMWMQCRSSRMCSMRPCRTTRLRSTRRIPVGRASCSWPSPCSARPPPRLCNISTASSRTAKSQCTNSSWSCWKPRSEDGRDGRTARHQSEPPKLQCKLLLWMTSCSFTRTHTLWHTRRNMSQKYVGWHTPL